MPKQLTVLFIFVLSSLVHASETSQMLLFKGRLEKYPSELVPAANLYDQDAPDAFVGECSGGRCTCFKKHHLKFQISGLVKAGAISEHGMPFEGGHRFKYPDFPYACRAFIDKQGNLGIWGEHVVSAASRIAPNCFYHRNLFGSLCPNYLKLSVPQKNTLIAMAFAAIATAESSCEETAQTQGVNDIADGMFMLEYSKSQRQAAGRNKDWCRTNESVDTQDIQFQSECAVSIIEDTVCSWKSYIFDAGGYWEKLRSKGRSITQTIQQTAKGWKLCK